MSDYYNSRKEELLKYQKEYYEKNKERIAKKTSEHRKAKRKATGKIRLKTPDKRLIDLALIESIKNAPKFREYIRQLLKEYEDKKENNK